MVLSAFFKCQITFFVVLFFVYLFTVCDVNNLAIEAASYWIERDMADYEWTREWVVMLCVIGKQKQTLKHSNNSTTRRSNPRDTRTRI